MEKNTNRMSCLIFIHNKVFDFRIVGHKFVATHQSFKNVILLYFWVGFGVWCIGSD